MGADASAFTTLYIKRRQDNSPTNQLAFSQVAYWSTRVLINSPKSFIYILQWLIAINVICG